MNFALCSECKMYIVGDIQYITHCCWEKNVLPKNHSFVSMCNCALCKSYKISLRKPRQHCFRLSLSIHNRKSMQLNCHVFLQFSIALWRKQNWKFTAVLLKQWLNYGMSNIARRPMLTSIIGTSHKLWCSWATPKYFLFGLKFYTC